MRTCLGPVPRRVREGVSGEAAERLAVMKKLDMAEAAEQFLVGTNQLPALLRTPLTQPEQMAASNKNACLIVAE